MNRFKLYTYTVLIYGVALICFSSCTKLDVQPVSTLTPQNFPTTPAQYIAATGPIYTSFRVGPGRPFWLLENLSTDENVLVARGGNWYDGAQYAQMNLHTVNADNPTLDAVWQWGFSTISTCNQVLSLFNSVAASTAKSQTVAEIKTMRALSYFYMMDNFGNIPISKTFGDTTNLGTQSRATVFAFIESELLAQIPNLSATVGVSTYGRPTKYLAYAILAKMYLNAEYYTGTQRYNDAVAMCDKIITGGQYGLDADYLAMFKPNNGPQIKDFIFAVPYDGVEAQGQYYARWTLHPALQAKYSMPYAPDGPMYTYSAFYALYTDANDVRKKQYLTGKQYYNDGTPILITTTNQGLDANYSGSDPGGTVIHQLEFTPNIVWTNASIFDIGNDELANEEGYRNNKFYPDSTSTTRNQGNDVPMFRYADILLVKAEAILRGATATNGDSPLTLINQVRNRAGAASLTSVTLSDILDERGREFTVESWRRNDLIRFGQYEKAWGIKTDVNAQHRIFPIPNPEIQLNPKLVQNPGY
ncbi:putative outer membrane starch-binding protein [Mucilaginibacter frigoritolerans]|uniref:Putative outer membrane starch-binding protein n=1 Tax=Mucilaginibacter frigoritolerans TaxID=652788 RepID=A0A562TK77_9SPHI|nr:RagB/SusD family nutrient uptake outer membrane protein [Mucilaginibacter frigoritolerans]TWI93925.1 putative outer membrane starch-binding protein [Mucilaginibacter frigoritolerans]